MYDDAARGALGRPHQGHWYDEPPYESDPDDFLMSGMNLGPAATIQVSSDRHSRFQFTFCTYHVSYIVGELRYLLTLTQSHNAILLK